MYEPTSGAIFVDDTPLARIAADEWRARLRRRVSGFLPLRISARARPSASAICRVSTIGRRWSPPSIAPAPTTSSSRLQTGLETQLGPTWPGGVDVSFGQWQKLALARGFMRDEPLLLILDEPTAALDAETEHALFERYAAAVRARPPIRHGRSITLLVSHRFSTVRMADLIVVLSGAKVAEIGTHEELMAKRGPYAELYAIQAKAYR